MEFFLKAIEKKRNKYVVWKIVRKFFVLPMSKLDSIEKIISKAVTGTDISQECFVLVSNEAENYHRLEEKMNE